MWVGVIIVGVVLLGATGFGVWRARTDGVVRERDVASDQPSEIRLTPDQLGGELGSRATLVQFSSAFCQPCRTAKLVLSDVAAKVDGVKHVEIDAESHLELVRSVGIMRTPTTLILDAAGRVTARAAGVPRKDQVLSAIAKAG